MKRSELSAIFLLPMLVAACGEDDAGYAPVEENAIRFTALAGHEARSNEVTTNTLTEFNVFAYTDGQLYMDDVKVSKDADNTWTYSPVMYWPTTPVNFFAYSPAQWLEGISNVNQTVTYDNDGNTDLIYAVNMNEEQSTSPVQLNFRHAMCHVEVELMSTTPSIAVSVSGIKLAGINKTGTFKFPQMTTAPGVATSAGVWSGLTALSEYTYYDGSTSPTVLTSTATGFSDSCSGFLLPQNLTAMTSDTGGYSGSYICVDCVINDKATGALLWPNGNTPPQQVVTDGDKKTGRLFFSLSNSDLTHWNDGYRYVYRITINNAEGMEPIDFDPSVEIFTEKTSLL